MSTPRHILQPQCCLGFPMEEAWLIACSALGWFNKPSISDWRSSTGTAQLIPAGDSPCDTFTRDYVTGEMPLGVREEAAFSPVTQGGNPGVGLGGHVTWTSLVTSPWGHSSALRLRAFPRPRVWEAIGVVTSPSAPWGKHPKILMAWSKLQRGNSQPCNHPSSGIAAGFSLQSFPKSWLNKPPRTGGDLSHVPTAHPVS